MIRFSIIYNSAILTNALWIIIALTTIIDMVWNIQ